MKVGLGIEENIVPQSSCIANVVGFASHNILESSLALRMLEFCERRDQSFCKAAVESIQCSRKFENVQIWTQSAISCNSISYLLQIGGETVKWPKYFYDLILMKIGGWIEYD